MAVFNPFRPAKHFQRRLRRYLPPLTFITVHYSYFIVVCLISSVIFWGSSNPSYSVNYTDSLFLTVSAMTLAGLNTVNLSTLTTFQQFILFILIIIGSAIFVSSFVVRIRRKAFERLFIKAKNEQMFISGAGPSRIDGVMLQPQHIRRTKTSLELDRTPTRRSRTLPSSQVGGSPEPTGVPEPQDHTSQDNESSGNPASPEIIRRLPSRVRTDNGVEGQTYGRRGLYKYMESAGIKTGAFIGRNSHFHNLTHAEREQLGGVEYRALLILEVIVPLYFILWQLIGCLGLGGYMTVNRASTARENGLNPFWVGAFIAVSAFNNSGMCLLDANLVPFKNSPYTLLTAGLLILAGNTAYPVCLRLIIWTLSKLIKDCEKWHDWSLALQFLLEHPRRCYMTLFPSIYTWYLLATLLVLNGIDWAAFEILNIGNSSLRDVPTKYRVLDGLFQAFAVRSGGFYIAAIGNLNIALQVLYVLMMYIGVYPIAISTRSTNVYQERSLGIYADDEDDYSDIESFHEKSAGKGFLYRWSGHFHLRPRDGKGGSRAYFVRQQLRSQLSHDMWWICLAVFFILIVESSQFDHDPASYSVFNFIFEVVSAYGCVGISIGVPGESYSFCGAWHKLSKLILCAVMLRGRHRGLPVAIDRAILLPGDQLSAAEDEDAVRRLERGVAN